MDRPYRRISVYLPGDDFEVLQILAERETRTPREQAAHLVRQSLASVGARINDNAGREPAGAGTVARTDAPLDAA